jgi:hypothetical protein
MNFGLVLTPNFHAVAVVGKSRPPGQIRLIRHELAVAVAFQQTIEGRTVYVRSSRQ